MPQFRKKPVVIEAVQWFHDVAHPGVHRDDRGEHGPHVITAHGQAAYLAEGDWILPEPHEGRFYPCKPDIFAATYDPIEEKPKEAGQHKPCPFCGSTNVFLEEFSDGAEAHCDDCGASGPRIISDLHNQGDELAKQAWDAWYRRAPEPFTLELLDEAMKIAKTPPKGCPEHMRQVVEALAAMDGQEVNGLQIAALVAHAKHALATTTPFIPERVKRARLQLDARPWTMFYRDGLNLGQIAEIMGCSIYDLSPWLAAPITRAVLDYENARTQHMQRTAPEEMASDVAEVNAAGK
jgi:hypothetical protein